MQALFEVLSLEGWLEVRDVIMERIGLVFDNHIFARFFFTHEICDGYSVISAIEHQASTAIGFFNVQAFFSVCYLNSCLGMIGFVIQLDEVLYWFDGSSFLLLFYFFYNAAEESV
jgi:hypothetical protein